MKTSIITLVAALSFTATSALAGGHTEGRVNAVVAQINNGKLSSDGVDFVTSAGACLTAGTCSPTAADVKRITSIFGDNGKGNGSEPFGGFDDHDPGDLGGGDSD